MGLGRESRIKLAFIIFANFNITLGVYLILSLVETVSVECNIDQIHESFWSTAEQLDLMALIAQNEIMFNIEHLFNLGSGYGFLKRYIPLVL